MTFDLGLWTLDFGPSTLDFRLWTFDLRLWTFDFGLSTFDFGLWTFDSGLKLDLLPMIVFGTDPIHSAGVLGRLDDASRYHDSLALGA